MLAFFGGPALLVALAVSMRTAGFVDSRAEIERRLLGFLAAAEAAAGEEGVDLPLLLAVASVESSGRPDARSRAGAVGLMQLLPNTALEMSLADGVRNPDLTDPRTSLRLGARYLRRQLDAFADEPRAGDLALCAYNAGPGNVAAWIRRDPPDPAAESLDDWIPGAFSETRAFVRRVREWEVRWTERLSGKP